MAKYRRFVKKELQPESGTGRPATNKPGFDSAGLILKGEGPADGIRESEGVLYLCATPIGNLEDITLRVLRVLREVDLIAAEDTRRTRGLLSHFGISKPLTSYYLHNQQQKGSYLIEKMAQGQKIALVSDAGTPGISDPGEDLVNLALKAGIRVCALPGPSVVPLALSVSGLNTRRFVFEGFLPRPRREKTQRIKELAGETRTVILFEAPHRLLETLELLLAVWGSRKAAVVREASKKFEEIIRGSLFEIVTHFKLNPPRGEMTLVIAGNENSATSGVVNGMETEGEAAEAPGSPGKMETAPGFWGEAGTISVSGGNTAGSLADITAELMEQVKARAALGENPKHIIRELARVQKLNRRGLYQAWLKVRQAEDPAGDY